MTHSTSSTPAMAQVLRIVREAFAQVNNVGVAAGWMVDVSAAAAYLDDQIAKASAPEREAAREVPSECSHKPVYNWASGETYCVKCRAPMPDGAADEKRPPAVTVWPPPAWDAEKFLRQLGYKRGDFESAGHGPEWDRMVLVAEKAAAYTEGQRAALGMPGYTELLTAASRGYTMWAMKEHNKKWHKMLEGTPIINDAIVCICTEIMSSLSPPAKGDGG